MNQTLGSKQWVPLSDDERDELMAEARRLDLTVGLLARALLLDGLDRIETSSTIRRIELEKTETKRRISEGARLAARARWGAQEES